LKNRRIRRFHWQLGQKLLKFKKNTTSEKWSGVFNLFT